MALNPLIQILPTATQIPSSTRPGTYVSDADYHMNTYWPLFTGNQNTLTSQVNGLVVEINAESIIMSGYETNASASAASALASETNASTSETNAGLSETASALSETNASTSETNAGLSETASALSETNASTSETNAGLSETASALSETNAGLSETASALSETNASTSETNAGLSETASALSETNASTSETNAEDWAVSTTLVLATDYSSKNWAISSGVIAEKSAKEWATISQTNGSAPSWVSGNTYTYPELVTSPTDFNTYRVKTTYNGIIDPALSPTDWAKLTGSSPTILDNLLDVNTTGATTDGVLYALQWNATSSVYNLTEVQTLKSDTPLLSYVSNKTYSVANNTSIVTITNHGDYTAPVYNITNQNNCSVVDNLDGTLTVTHLTTGSPQSFDITVTNSLLPESDLESTLFTVTSRAPTLDYLTNTFTEQTNPINNITNYDGEIYTLEEVTDVGNLHSVSRTTSAITQILGNITANDTFAYRINAQYGSLVVSAWVNVSLTVEVITIIGDDGLLWENGVDANNETVPKVLTDQQDQEGIDTDWGQYENSIEQTDALNNILSSYSSPTATFTNVFSLDPDGSNNASITTTVSPILTSNTSNVGEYAFSKTLNGSYPAFKAFDGIITGSIGWAGTATINEYLGYKFDSGKIINKIGINDNADIYYFSDFEIQGSNDFVTIGGATADNGTWTNLKTVVGKPYSPNAFTYISFVNSTAYTSYRIQDTSGSASRRVQELDFIEAQDTAIDPRIVDGEIIYGVNGTTVTEHTLSNTAVGTLDPDGANNTSTTDSVPDMTSNTSPSGLAFATDLFAGSAFQVFNDDSLANFGITITKNGANIVGYISNTSHIVNKMRFARRDTAARDPEDFKIQGSNNSTTGSDGSWTDLVSITNFVSNPTNNSWNDYVTFSNSTSYTGYRILLLSNTGSNAYYEIPEMEFIDVVGTPTTADLTPSTPVPSTLFFKPQLATALEATSGAIGVHNFTNANGWKKL